MTRGDNIRRFLQDDEGLADFLLKYDVDRDLGFCEFDESSPCFEWMNEVGFDGADPEWCRQCLIRWLGEQTITGENET